MAFLLQARFNASGPTSSDIVNLGGVSFNHDSKIYNGDKCAFFEPSDDYAGLQIKGNTLRNVSNRIGADNAEYSIYFKFCIDLTHRMDNTKVIPIISYINAVTGMPYQFLSIEGNDHFTYCPNDETKYQSKKCRWIFDNNWHTFVLNKTKHLVTIFLDGFVYTVLSAPEIVAMRNTPAMFIGYMRESVDIFDHNLTLQCGMIDDLCVTTDIVYTENFLPPNMYFVGSDTKENYYWDLPTLSAYMPLDVLKYTDDRMVRTAFHLNEKQKEWLPKRLRIQWHEEEYLWDHESFWRVSQSREYTAISFWGLEQPLLMDPYNEQYVDIFNAYYAWDEGQLYPFMLFIDRAYVRLSDIYIMKSNQYYTMFIKNRKPDKYNPIQSIEMVYIPFKVIYEEDEPKRTDMEPLYSFNKEGLLDPYKAVTFYYLDEENSPGITCSPIIDEDIPIWWFEGDGPPLTDKNLMKSYWRYGVFQEISRTNTYVTVQFNSSDMDYRANVGDKVILYRNKISMEEDAYDIVGTDRFRFYYDRNANCEGLFNKTITMQIISEEPVQDIYNDLTTMKEVTVNAEEPNQNTFKIPDVTDDDGFKYIDFLVFRNSVCMKAKDRFKYTNHNQSITFTNPMDIINRGDPITFIFLKNLRADQYGPLHLKANYLYTYTGAEGVPTSNNTTSVIKIPPYRNLQFGKNNVLMFVHGSFINPDRYTISDNTVYMNSSMYMNNFELDKEVTFVVLVLVNDLQDPTTPRGKVLYHQMKQGARFVLYDLLIDKKVKMTLDNFVVFDYEGRYMPNITGEVFNLNIIKYIKSTVDPLHIVPRYLTVVYDKTKSLENQANILLPENTQYMKDYVRLMHELYEMDLDFDLFIQDFDIKYSRDEHYGVNLSKAFLYMIGYNQLQFLDLYKKRAEMQRIKLDPEKINKRIEESGFNGDVVMERSEYRDPAHRTFAMFFEDGMLPDWQGTIKYDLNQMYIRFPRLLDTDKELEVIKFHNMNNAFYKLQSHIK